MPKPCSSFPQHVPDLQSLRCQSPQQGPFSHGFEWSLSHSSVCLYVPPSPLELHVCTEAPGPCFVLGQGPGQYLGGGSRTAQFHVGPKLFPGPVPFSDDAGVLPGQGPQCTCGRGGLLECLPVGTAVAEKGLAAA